MSDSNIADACNPSVPDLVGLRVPELVDRFDLTSANQLAEELESIYRNENYGGFGPRGTLERAATSKLSGDDLRLLDRLFVACPAGEGPAEETRRVLLFTLGYWGDESTAEFLRGLLVRSKNQAEAGALSPRLQRIALASLARIGGPIAVTAMAWAAIALDPPIPATALGQVDWLATDGEVDLGGPPAERPENFETLLGKTLEWRWLFSQFRSNVREDRAEIYRGLDRLIRFAVGTTPDKAELERRVEKLLAAAEVQNWPLWAKFTLPTPVPKLIDTYSPNDKAAIREGLQQFLDKLIALPPAYRPLFEVARLSGAKAGESVEQILGGAIPPIMDIKAQGEPFAKFTLADAAKSMNIPNLDVVGSES